MYTRTVEANHAEGVERKTVDNFIIICNKKTTSKIWKDCVIVENT